MTVTGRQVVQATGKQKKEARREPRLFFAKVTKNRRDNVADSTKILEILLPEALDASDKLCYNSILRGYVPRILSCRQGELAVLSEVASRRKVVGLKQSARALREGSVSKVFFACDADPMVLAKLETLCRQHGIAVEKEATMTQLGQAAGIAVGASVIALLRD